MPAIQRGIHRTTSGDILDHTFMKKRLVVLRYLREACFTEERPYPEKEVNQRLALFHPDVASLRRHMVDAGLMTREAGQYRRPPGDLA